MSVSPSTSTTDMSLASEGTLDVEAGANTAPIKHEKHERTQTAEKTRDPYEVAWDGPDDPLCPLNKAAWRKW
jgi:hypothetical protein